MPRDPLSDADKRALVVLFGASKAELTLALRRAPGYQRAAVQELARIVETIHRAAQSAALSDEER